MKLISRCARIAGLVEWSDPLFRLGTLAEASTDGVRSPQHPHFSPHQLRPVPGFPHITWSRIVRE